MNTKVALAAIAVLSGLAIASTPLAAKTYTPAQLRQMVASGNLPDQAAPTSKTQALAFSECVAKVNGVVGSVRAQYPVKTVVNTSIMYMVKLWTNDSAMTLTCSAPDQKLIITTAKYR